MRARGNNEFKFILVPKKAAMIRSKIASHAAACAKRMTFLWALLALALHVVPGAVGPVHAQGSRKDDIVFNSRGIPLAGATVRVCAMPASGQPCTPLALIYSDAALSQALANPTTTDGLGNYFFYAAPGKYEIEISGPAITTKQIPNVILPNDPASPTFTGAISAFSLNLSGNLTVNGNTTVVGNLASGTLNLSNQSTPLGSAGAGTVNLYTKSADKRLYYKDETGTESGPLGAGAQTNAANTFTANQNFDNGMHIKGPDPYFDVMRFGGYSGSYPFAATTTGNITAGQTSLTTPSAFDVVNGQYVTVYGAGPASTIYAPGTPAPVSSISVSTNVATVNLAVDENMGTGNVVTIAGSSDAAFNGNFTTLSNSGAYGFTFSVTHANCSPCTIGGSTTAVLAPPFVTGVAGILNGSTTYQYKIVAEDLKGGLSAASAPIVISSAAATLGQNNATIANAGCSRDSTGLVTITTTLAHNFQVGARAFIVPGTTGDSNFEGNVVINTTPTSTTFTFYQRNYPAVASSCTGGTVTVVAKNVIRWSQRYNSIIGHWIYRCNGSGCTNYVLAGHTDGVDGAFADTGLGGPTGVPAYVPTGLPPSAPANQYLSAQVTAGGGTTTLTLSVAASNTVSGATVLHDNTPAVAAICAAIGGAAGTIYFPNNQGAVYPVTSFLDMSTVCTSPGLHVLQGGRVSLLAPIRPPGHTFWEGVSGNVGVNFGAGPQQTILGNAFPLLLTTGSTNVSSVFQNINLSCNQKWQSCWFADNTYANGTIMTFRNFSSSSAGGGYAFHDGGQFQYLFDQVSFGNQATTSTWGVYADPWYSTISWGIGQTQQALMSDMTMNFANFFSGGMVFENHGQTLAGGLNSLRFSHILCEGCVSPIMRFDLQNTGINSGGIDAEYLTYADTLAGGSTGLMDFQGVSSSSYSGVRLKYSSCAQGNQPAVTAGSYISGLQLFDISTSCGGGAGLSTTNVFSGSFGNDAVQIGGIGTVGYGMATPAAPTVTAVAGAQFPAGTYNVQIAWVDAFGQHTYYSPVVPVTTSGGNLNIQITPPAAPIGATGYYALVNGNFADFTNSACFNVVKSPATAVGTPVNANCSGFGGSNNAAGRANQVAFGSAGIETNSLTLTNGLTNTFAGSYTGNRTTTFPDVSGTVPTSGYLNSAYDNATRANGAIGSNWTVQQNGLNIASNQIQGTTGSSSNTAFWNANSFSTVQFSQAAVTALNGTTDFPGVTALASGTGATSTYYDCVENSNTIFLQRVVNAGTTNLTSTASTGAVGDILRLEAGSGGTLTCFKNGVSALTATDTQITSGSPGLLISGNVATEKNWSGGNLHPLGHLDTEQDWIKPQHFTQGVAFGTETFAASPRAEQNIFLPGALTSTWTASTWTNDKAVTITRVQVQAKTAPAGCTTNAIVRLTDGTTPVNLTISAAANDSGAISQNYAAGSSLQVLVQNAAAGCTTSPADANVTVQYRMQ
jgi:hypothetical protein